MKVGDKVKARWADGLVLEGVYSERSRGYVILVDESGRQIVCDPSYVEFEVLNETR